MDDDLGRPLSAKAKGKQRAVDPIDDEEDLEAHASGLPGSYPEPSTRMLTIRFTEGIQDLTLTIDDSETVRDIKKQVSVGGFEGNCSLTRDWRYRSGLYGPHSNGADCG